MVSILDSKIITRETLENTMNILSGRTLFLMLTALLLAACDSPSALQVTRSEARPLTLRANLQTASSSLAPPTLTILDVDKLPAELLKAQLLEVVFDTSKTRITVTRNPDGTLTFPFRSSRAISGNGSLSVILIGDRSQSYPVQLETGPELALDFPALEFSPAATMTQGGRVTIKARFKQPEKAAEYDFFWSYATSLTGPWQSISGNSERVTWDAVRVGNYFLRLEMRHRQNLSVSSYTTPTAQLRVLDSDRLALTEPASGAVLEGEKITLRANLPEYSESQGLRYLWSYAPSPQGPFVPLSAEGVSITWDPPRAGSYYLRLQVLSGQDTSTYISSQALVQVSPADSVITTQPASGSLVRGEAVTLSTTLPEAPERNYTWFYGLSPQASFSPIPGSGRSLQWRPTLTGDFYLRLRISDAKTGQTRSYTSSKSLVSVRDSDALFTTVPAPASLRKGESVQLTLNDSAASTNTVWSYASAAQGPFLPIPATGRSVLWTPPSPGSFYLRAESPRADGSLATWVSANSLVTVSERSDVIFTEPTLANLQLGQPVVLRSTLSIPSGSYSWSYASSPVGPFIPVPSLESGSRSAVTWYPTQSGSWYIRLEVTDPATRSTVSFTSEQPLVQVIEKAPFFSTEPADARLATTDDVLIKARFDAQGRAFNYGWAYSRSAAGPYTPLGGSTLPEYFWNDPVKPVGSYYLRFTATPPDSERSLTYFSRTPLLFVSSGDEAAPEFGL